ncbi:recombination regulator RecX [Parahaliea aestuarii]
MDRAAIRRAAMDLLARREHSLQELRQKLHRRFGGASELAVELQRLQEENLQSDSRYAESFARQRMLRGYGPLRLRQEMRQKGIPEAEASLALEALDIDWYSHAQAVCDRKFGTGPAADLKEKGRRQRFLQYRGFSQDHISACLHS